MGIDDPKATIQRMGKLAAAPLSEERENRRVEIIMLKFKESPEIIDKAVTRIIHNTDWPFKLNIFDNRPLPGEENNRNTAKIWNKLVAESTCRFVLIIDSDAYIPAKKTNPCWLTRLMESIDETGIVIPVCSTGGGAHQHVTGPEAHGSRKLNHDAWSGFCFLFDRERIKETFDERFYIYGQDSEFALRTNAKYGGALMRRDVFVEHIGGASFKEDDDRDEDKFYARKLFVYLTKDYV